MYSPSLLYLGICTCRSPQRQWLLAPAPAPAPQLRARLSPAPGSEQTQPRPSHEVTQPPAPAPAPGQWLSVTWTPVVVDSCGMEVRVNLKMKWK